ncbi:MAG TPA: hypothetical protein VL327_05595 [Pyrinomonadaceae bacterium]|jgi:hypothetical protein|nr:hypothetical protein [Pyrinomonadaceae bacterium]
MTQTEAAEKTTQTQTTEELTTPAQAKFNRILADLTHAAISYISQDGSVGEKDNRTQTAIEMLRPSLIYFSDNYRNDSPPPQGQCYYDPVSGQWICPGNPDY